MSTEILLNPVLEILSLPHINHPLRLVFHEIDTGLSGKSTDFIKQFRLHNFIAPKKRFFYGFRTQRGLATRDLSRPNHMDSGKISRFRFIKAYTTTFSILWRYAWRAIVGKFISPERSQELYYITHKKTARQITKTLLELKGLYIKIGQTLSVMSNILPVELTEGLESLQDSVPPHPFEEVNKRFLADFGKTAEELFQTIEPIPIASASLGQVHVATHKNGDKLAVKLQYPNIDIITRRDLKTIQNIFGIVHLIFPQYNLKEVFEECRDTISKELDYLNEAKNIELIESNNKDNQKIVFPKVYHELSSKKVLTLSFVEGSKITQLSKVTPTTFDTKSLAVTLIHFYCKQIFQDGVYHADPHPGNIIITPDGKIGMLDFGAVATVSRQMREGLTQFIEGLIKKDSRLLAEALKQMGFVSKKNDDETLEHVVDYFYSKISRIKIDNFRNLDVTQFHNLNDLIELNKMDISLRDLTTLFVVPRDWILLERTIILMTGLTAQLDPKQNPVEIVIPYVEKFLLGDDNKKLAEILLSTSKEVILSYMNLPDDIRKFIKKVRNDGLRITSTSLKKELSGIRRSINLFATAFLASISGILCYLMTEQHHIETASHFEIAFYGFGVLFVLMLLRR